MHHLTSLDKVGGGAVVVVMPYCAGIVTDIAKQRSQKTHVLREQHVLSAFWAPLVESVTKERFERVARR